MQRGFNFYRQFIALIILLSLSISTFAQVKKPTSGGQAKAPATCSGAWTGNITYSKTISMADSKTVERVSNRGKDEKKFEMNYRYKASVAVLEDKTTPGSNIGKAFIEHRFTSVDQTSAEERNSCDQGKTWKVMKGEFESKTEIRGQASGQPAITYVAVNSDGSYSVGISLQPIQGVAKGEEKSSYSGQCQPKEGKNVTMPDTPTNIEGNRMNTNGSHRIDPKDPNKLSGSWSQTLGNSTETITWNLQKCGGQLRITDIQFEDMKFPNWNDWQEITEQRGTIDGNFVKIKAKILNESGETKYADLRFKETYKGDKWDGAKPDAPLEDSVRSVRIDANSEETVEMIFDSAGYAWFDDGRPRLVQRIKTELEENGKKIDERTENLKVAPKPVVLVHGLWSNWRAFESWQNILTTSHSYDWKAFPVGEKPENGVMNTGKEFMSTDKTDSIGDNAYQLAKYIEYTQKDRNAWHVDIVAHSMGGLISRWYIDQLMKNYTETPRPRVAHLVMLGTPNMGSPCADVMDLTFDILGKQVEAVRQLRTDYIEGFNKIHTQRKGVKFSALAGNSLPGFCKWSGEGDGVVPVTSALWTIKDTGLTDSIHTDLTGTKDFSGFVKPRLAIGPKGNHLPEIPQMTGQN
ncbi:MAG TPA: alpha/beta hydrolase [Pyrinomonadaceae bacterium]|nr:alpha/beta hydrolase [Pyrinomonadaceae bacterium]